MTNTLTRLAAPALLLVAAVATPAIGQNSASVGFDAGSEGWSINGLNAITPTGGNPAEHVRWNNPVDTFGISARTSTHAAFLGDYTAKGEVTLSIDMKVNFITFFGSPVPRNLVVELFDDDPFGAAPPAQVWFPLTTLQGSGQDWMTFSTTVTDVFSDTLPDGWRGAGDEDPMTFEPILPAGRTWTNVLAGVDRIEFTTFEPGFFFGFTNFDVSMDNVSIQPLPPQTAWSDEGDALAGVFGDPALTGTGTLAGMTVNSVDLSNAATSAPMALFIGFASNPVSFKGGTLVPVPNLILSTSTDGGGNLAVPFVMPAGAPAGAELWVQAAILDGAAVAGVSLSNAILGVTP